MRPAPPTPDLSDEALFVRYRERGDLEAFARLYDRYATSVYRFLVRLLRDSAAAEDVAQHAFLRIHEGRHSFDERRSFRTWMFTIARRLAANWLERHGSSGPGDTLEELPDPLPSPERRAIARDEARALERALRMLAREDAEVLLLSRYEELSYEEIGEVVGCSPDAAKMRVHRALKRLAERIVTDLRPTRKPGGVGR
jgi:RNA polymerase sigma-70 factor (ECF subfamily)